MIEHLSLRNFKCFEEIRLPLGRLMLITGVNGVGKSSIVQALLLLRQSNDDKKIDLHDHVKIDGDLIDLINADKMRYALSEDTDISIELTDDQGDKLTFLINKAITDVKEIACECTGDLDKALENWSLFNRDFVYLYADRTAPQKSYRKGVESSTDSRLGDKHGSRTAFRLYEATTTGEKIGISALSLEGDTVVGNISAWISFIMGGQVRVSADQEGADQITLNYSKTINGNEIVFSPLNVAFGNSYILPILLAILTAPAGSLIIIENPEAHLHPSAQFRMGQFLALAAQNGVQIIVETHSDHLLNGVRVLVTKPLNGQKMDANKVEIHYIYQDEENPALHLDERIMLEEDGSLDHWPIGFFDEWELALRSLNCKEDGVIPE